ncbi:hypothetical protein IMZ11_15940 [Microtetraspora sp. AC03309]|uniref:WXG100 family type VII secretion target n=1 Tax=Microtetraspora sp. AC03309 TaxID=2779376 RepID=UPI001E375771|nr:hypothetical protein [Microtetraspora sp. AC03309]MCC5577117.1 hypothetical protein [Microtetraspora sp. AC03309]
MRLDLDNSDLALGLVKNFAGDMVAAESARWKFREAFAVASVAAVLLVEYPVTKTIALAIGTIVSNPGEMVRAASEWHVDSPEIDNLITALKSQRDKLAGRGNSNDETVQWSGSAFDTYSEAVDNFATELAKTKECRKGAGDCLLSSAQIYNILANIAFLVANAMMIWAVVNITSKGNPLVGVGVRGIIGKGLRALLEVLKSVFMKQFKIVAMLGATIVAVNMAGNQIASILPKMKAMPGPAPDLEQIKLTYKDGQGIVASQASLTSGLGL